MSLVSNELILVAEDDFTYDSDDGQKRPLLNLGNIDPYAGEILSPLDGFQVIEQEQAFSFLKIGVKQSLKSQKS